jgi:cell division septum initiation protein DivIVA
VDAQKEAATINADAKRDATTILADAQREADRIIADAAADAARVNSPAKEMAVRGAQMLPDAQELNPDLDPGTQAIIQRKVERRARQGCPRLELQPNLAVQCEVAYADPPTIRSWKPHPN